MNRLPCAPMESRTHRVTSGVASSAADTPNPNTRAKTSFALCGRANPHSTDSLVGCTGACASAIAAADMH